MASKNKNGNSSDGLTARVELRLHPASKTRLFSDAKKAGLSGSEYIRELAENGQVVINENSGASRDEINQTKQHGYSIMYLLKEYRTRGHPPSGNLDALFATQQQYYKHLLEKALQGVGLT